MVDLFATQHAPLCQALAEEHRRLREAAAPVLASVANAGGGAMGQGGGAPWAKNGAAGGANKPAMSLLEIQKEERVSKAHQQQGIPRFFTICFVSRQ